jgi:hypothetical protein
MATLADHQIAQRFEGLLWGPPGSGKTVLAHSFPRTRTLNFDGPSALDSVWWAIKEKIIDKKLEDIVFENIVEDTSGKYGSVKKATALDAASDQIDLWLKDPNWETLIIDSGTELSEATINKGLAANARLGLSKSKEQGTSESMRVMRVQDWGAAGSLFQQFINWVRTIDKNIILICHEYTDTDENGSVIQYEPALIGQLRQKITKSFGEVYHLGVSGSRQAPVYEMQTAPDPKHVCKTRLGCLKPIMPASYKALADAISTYYNIPKEELWQRKQGKQ